MTTRRIFAILGIFALACGGWAVLGTTTLVRSESFADLLGERVGRLWGGPIVQRSPGVTLLAGNPNTSNPVAGADSPLPPSANRVRARLVLDYRKKGLIWYPTFVSYFEGTYGITNPENTPKAARFHFLFPSDDATYDNVAVELDGEDLDVALNIRDGISEVIDLEPGETRTVTVAYQTRGLSEWRYRPDGLEGRVRNLDLVVRTSFFGVDYPDDSLSPMDVTATDDGMTLTWRAQNLLTTQDVAVLMPERINPGPLSGRITYFAPVCLFFFFLMLGTINIMRRLSIHPMHYLFVAGGFFAFHLMFAYLVDHVAVHLAFVLAAVTSVGLVTAYLRGALGPRFPWLLAAGGQIFYLVLFSYSFFLTGMTGLTVTLGSIATLAMLMAVTAKIDWNALFARPKKTAAVGGEA